MRPPIGVTTSRRGGWRSLIFHRLALRRAGGKAVRLIPGTKFTLNDVSGLIIGGGDDVGAELYGGELMPDVRVDPERDAFELQLLESALPTRLPILGICRGAQIINIALGGTLHGDIYVAYARAKRMRTVLPRKKVWIEEESRLAQILACNPCRVNTLHHQSVDRLGRGLRVVGRDDAGVVQAIEATGERFLIGVQWHPEFLIHSSAQRRLFNTLVAQARRNW